jgi:hypothetical protein
LSLNSAILHYPATNKKKRREYIISKPTSTLELENPLKIGVWCGGVGGGVSVGARKAPRCATGVQRRTCFYSRGKIWYKLYYIMRHGFVAHAFIQEEKYGTNYKLYYIMRHGWVPWNIHPPCPGASAPDSANT